ncbi:MAG: replication-relaxation family protein [Actinomycetota bacterium]
MLKHPQTERAACLASFLTSRDRKICLDLYEHKVLTTHQVVDLSFDSQRVAERRLLKLFQYGVVLRFRPVLEQGSSPHHFVTGRSGCLCRRCRTGSRGEGIEARKRPPCQTRLQPQTRSSRCIQRLLLPPCSSLPQF